MAEKLPKSITIEPKKIIDELEHAQQHILLLQKYYSDLSLLKEENNIHYYSSDINSIAKEAKFETKQQTGNWITYYIYPYIQSDIKCSKCNITLRINTIPNQYLLLTKQIKSVYLDSKKDNIIICSSFEEIMKKDKISKEIIDNSKLYVIDLLNKEKLNEYDDVVLPSSIEQLIIFS